MKSKEEIEKLAFLKYPRLINDNPLCRNPSDPMEDDNTFERKIWIGAYTQCQEDMAKKWISVKDELPPINVPLLCYQKNKNCQFRKMVLGFDGKEFKNFYNGNDDDILFEDGNYKFITHWMSLPNKPLNKQDQYEIKVMSDFKKGDKVWVKDLENELPISAIFIRYNDFKNNNFKYRVVKRGNNYESDVNFCKLK